jgi:thiamine-phosphate diphosphorylase
VVPTVCLVTDRRRLAPDAPLEDQLDRLVAQTAEAGSAGVDLIQVRERDLDGGLLTRLTKRMLDAAGPAKVIINERADVALAAGAHGAHLRGDSFDAVRLRRIAPDRWVIGRSIHAIAETASSAAAVDYLIFGPIYPTPSKPGAPPAGVAELKKVAATADRPLLAIGGITLARLSEIAASGAAGVAGIELFLPPTRDFPERPGLEAAVQAIRAAFGTAFD